MLSESVITNCGKLFIGDLSKKNYSRKSLDDISTFFKNHFDVVRDDEKKNRLSYTNICLNEINTFDKLTSFFNIILSNDYLRKDLNLHNVDTIATKKKDNVEIINRYLAFDKYKLIVENNSCFLKMDNDLYDYLDSGAFSKIYINKEKTVILKKLHEQYYIDAGAVSRFEREYKIMKKLNKVKGIVRVFDFDRPSLSYTMEYAGRSVEEHIKSCNISELEKVQIIAEFLVIIKNVHKREILHRDLNPRNIFIKHNNVLVGDFGLAKDLATKHSHNSTDTNCFGRQHYTEPKQLRCLKEADKLSDIFSIGRCINFIMTKDPYNINHKFKILSEKATADREIRYPCIKDLYNDFLKILSSLTSTKEYKDLSTDIKNRNLCISLVKHLKTENYDSIKGKIIDENYRWCLQKVMIEFPDDTKINNLLTSMMEDFKNNPLSTIEANGLSLLLIFIINNFTGFNLSLAIECLNYLNNELRFEESRINTKKKITIDNIPEKILNELTIIW